MNKTLVFNACEETHVFVNKIGSVTIHQISSSNEDYMIEIPLVHIETLIKALRNAKREILAAKDK